jgi:hypothetical protein
MRDLRESNSKIPPEVIDTCSIVLEPRLHVAGLNVGGQNFLLSQIDDFHPLRGHEPESAFL